MINKELNYTGTIISISATKQINDSFKKREFVVMDQTSPYPHPVLFELQQDKCLKLNNFEVGDLVEVSFNLKGRKWTDKTGEVKYFNTLEAWKIALVAGENLDSQPENTEKKDEDDLPF